MMGFGIVRYEVWLRMENVLLEELFLATARLILLTRVLGCVVRVRAKDIVVFGVNEALIDVCGRLG